MDSIVIVGAGETGVAAALALRGTGWTGRIDLIGAESQRPYERPPLSKVAILGDAGATFPAIMAATDLASYNITHHLGVSVTMIDRLRHFVRLADGRQVSYDRLLIATGSRARQLGVPGEELVATLRTYEDAIAFRGRIGPNRRLLVFGGGLIGLEIAASARVLGTEVVIIEAGPLALRRAVPAALAASIVERHVSEGVQFHFGARVSHVREAAGGVTAYLDDGRFFFADAAVAGVGVLPETSLAEAAGLAIDNGVAVDGRLCTLDPDVFAAGDCCSFPHPLFGNRRIRVETWRNAQQQGSFVAASLLGARDLFSSVPGFWSDQYDLHMQVVGMTDGSETLVERDIGLPARLVFHVATDGRLVAAGAVGPIGRVAREVRLAEILIARSVRPDPRALAAPGTRLKDLVAD